jgi:hypothetical protein
MAISNEHIKDALAKHGILYSISDDKSQIIASNLIIFINKNNNPLYNTLKEYANNLDSLDKSKTLFIKDDNDATSDDLDRYADVVVKKLYNVK